MSGQKIVLTGVSFTDPSLPILADDPLLVPGSLLLWDPSHSMGAFDGVPTASGAPMPNVAWKEAAAILGGGGEADLAFKVNAAITGLAAGQAQAERTAKGGVHVMMTHAGLSASRGWAFNAATAIRDYIYANRNTHQFYVSMWRRQTRPSKVGVNPAQSPFHFINDTGATSNNLFTMSNGVFSQSAPGIPQVHNVPSTTENNGNTPAGTNRYSSARISGGMGTGPTATQQIMAGVGSFSSWNSFNQPGPPSAILYRVYLEDLTVSGRTYEQVDAINHALWQAAFAAGGKYHGDTYSDPATAVP